MPRLDRADIAMLSVVVAISVIFYLKARLYLRRDRSKIQKYRFYKVRDDLIFLVASHQIEEDDFVFQLLYKAINFLIQRTGTLTLRSLLKALKEGREQGVDPAAENVVKKLKSELHNKTPEIRKVVAEFYDAILKTLFENSFILRLVLRFSWLPQVIRKFRSWISAAAEPLPEVRAYFFYRQYRDAADRTLQDDFLAAA